MTTVSAPNRTRKPVPRSIRLALAPRDGGPGVVDVTMGHTTTSYFLRPLASDFGQAFELSKFNTQGGEVYAVNLNAQQSTCECAGFLRWGHCKHLYGIKALVQADKL